MKNFLYVTGAIINTTVLCTFGQVYIDQHRIQKAEQQIYENVSLDEVFVVDLSDVFQKRPVPKSSTLDDSCLAANIYHEARGEGEEGMKYVAMVTMNRVAENQWPDSICEVVYQPYQFSWTISGEATIDDQIAYAQSYEIAKKAIAGEIEDVSNGATHYFAHNKIDAPDWTAKFVEVAVLGNHTFYR